MRHRILPIDDTVTAGDERWLRIGAAVRSGGIVAVPTETFYGLAVDPRSSAAVQRLLALKGYGPGRPLLLLAESREAAEALSPGVRDPSLSALLDRFWPGPLTLVLRLGEAGIAAAGAGSSVAVRVPSSPVARRVAGCCGSLVTGTSANPAGAEPARTVSEVLGYFPEDLELVLDAGPTPGGLPSTLLDVTGETPRLVRSGAVSMESLQSFLGSRLGAPPPAGGCS